MKKKLLILILAIVGCLACVIGLSACESGSGANNGGTGNGGSGTTQTPPEEKPEEKPDEKLPVIETKDLISFKTLEVNDDSVYGKVSNATIDFPSLKTLRQTTALLLPCPLIRLVKI